MRDVRPDRRVELAFDLLAPPHVARLEGFRFAHARVRGPYEPWSRVQALDSVAEWLEVAGVDRIGPAFGVYHDLPSSPREPEGWTADLGWPIASDAMVPAQVGLCVSEVASVDVASLRYRGDLTSFPAALQVLTGWCDTKGHVVRGCLLERFHVSDALTGLEERDVYLALSPVPR